MARAFSIEDGGLSKQTTIKTTLNREYVDLDLSFAAKGSGDVYKKTAASSVVQAIKLMLMTNRTEKPFSPFFGANLNSYLFELADTKTRSDIEFAIRENVRVFEPRVNHKTLKITVDIDEGNNSMDVTVVFQVINSNEVVEFTTRLNRLR